MLDICPQSRSRWDNKSWMNVIKFTVPDTPCTLPNARLRSLLASVHDWEIETTLIKYQGPTVRPFLLLLSSSIKVIWYSKITKMHRHSHPDCPTGANACKKRLFSELKMGVCKKRGASCQTLRSNQCASKNRELKLITVARAKPL